jgi:hypothetical protein
MTDTVISRNIDLFSWDILCSLTADSRRANHWLWWSANTFVEHQSVCCQSHRVWNLGVLSNTIDGGVWMWTIFFFNFLGWGETRVHLVRRPLIGLFYQPRMVDEHGAVNGMRNGGRNRSTRRKPAPVSLCPPQIPHDRTCDRTLAAVVGSRRPPPEIWHGLVVVDCTH